MKTIIQTGIAAVLSLAVMQGCNSSENSDKRESLDEVVMKPISTGESWGHNVGNLVIVGEVEGKGAVLAYAKNYESCARDGTLKNAKAEALVEYKIKKNENIKLEGKYEGKSFHIKSLKVDDYELNFDWEK